MKSILGIGNALTDILAVLPNDLLLKQYHLPKGSMQHVDQSTGDKIWATLKPMGVEYVAGGSAANTINGAAVFGMRAGFIGKVGDDDVIGFFELALLLFNCNAGPVSYVLVGSRQRVEKGGFSAVRVACKGNLNRFVHLFRIQ